MTAAPLFGLKANPNLKFGVLSDIHITDWESTEILRKALGYFRDKAFKAMHLTYEEANRLAIRNVGLAKAWEEVSI